MINKYKKIQEDFRKDFMELCKKYGVFYSIDENYADITLYEFNGELNIEDFEEIKFEECRWEDEINERLEKINIWKEKLKGYEEELENSVDEKEIKQLNYNIDLCKRTIKNLNNLFGFKY